MTPVSRGSGGSCFPMFPVCVVVLIVVLIAVVTLVWLGYEVTAAISAVFACGLVAEEVCRRLGWSPSSRSS